MDDGGQDPGKVVAPYRWSASGQKTPVPIDNHALWALGASGTIKILRVAARDIFPRTRPAHARPPPIQNHGTPHPGPCGLRGDRLRPGDGGSWPAVASGFLPDCLPVYRHLRGTGGGSGVPGPDPGLLELPDPHLPRGFRSLRVGGGSGRRNGPGRRDRGQRADPCRHGGSHGP